MSILNIFQIGLELWGIIFSLIIAISSGIAAHRSNGVLKNVWTMLLLNCMLLSCDTLAYVYRGVTDSIGVIIEQVSNLGVFVIEGILMLLFTYIVQKMITGNKKMALKSLPYVISSVCVSIQLFGAVLTPFTGLYYYFDDMNYYVRGNWNFISFVLLGIVLVINIIEICKNKNRLSQKIWNTLIGVTVGIVLGVTAQLLFQAISFINIAITLGIIMLFINLWIDNRNTEFECHIKGMEAIINELTSGKKEGCR